MARLTLFTWLLCCFIGTMLLYVAYLTTSGDEFESSGSLYIAGIALVISLVASIPALIGFGLIANAVRHSNSVGRAKLITSVYAVFATFATFFIILTALSSNGGGSEEMSRAYLLAIPYAISFVFAICIQKWPGQQQQQKPDALWADDDLNPTWQDVNTGEPHQAKFPADIFFAVISVVVLGLVISVYQLAKPAFSFRGAFHPNLLWLIGIVLTTGGLILFCLRRSAGWKLLLALSAANIAGQMLSVITQVKSIFRAGLHSYLLIIAFYLAMDVAVIALLLRPSLRRAFRIPEQQQWVWMLCGAGYGIIRLLVLSKLSY